MSDFDVVQHFLAMTGARDENTAIEYLSLMDFNCDDAISAYFAANGGHRERQQPQQQRPSQPARATEAPFNLLNELLRHTNAVSPTPPPQTSYVEELDDDERPVTRSVDAVDQLFRFPTYAFNYLFDPNNAPNNYMGSINNHKTFPQCCTEALETQRWVLLVVFDEDSFVFGCLLRDIFNDPSVSAVLPDMAVLYLVEQKSEQGQQLVATYRLNAPTATSQTAKLHDVMVVDPLTRAMLSKLSMKANASGVFDSAVFLEKVTDLMLGREHPSTKLMNQVSDSQPPKPSVPSTTVVDDDDDDELQRALKMSEEQGTDSPKRKMPKVEVEQQPIVEPDLSPFLLTSKQDPEAFSLRIRLPNGETSDMILRKQTPLKAILDFLCFKVRVSDMSQLELRSGFPARVVSVTPDQILSQCPLRSGDMIIVQVVS